MKPMIPSPDVEPERPRGRALEPWVRHLVAIAAALSLGVFIASQRMSVSQEVRLVVPEVVAPGERFPVRVLVYRGLRAVEGPHLEAVTAQVRVLAGDDGPGGSRAQGPAVPLVPGFGDTLEAELRAPASARGPLTLSVDFPEDPEAPTAEVVVAVSDGSTARRQPQPQPRQVRPLQRLSLGPVRRAAGQRALLPAPLAVAVGGGGCVPERKCDVFVHVADDVVEVGLARTPSVTPLQQALGAAVPDPSGFDAGLGAPDPGASRVDGRGDRAPPANAMPDNRPVPPAVPRLQVVVHGPEAITELVAYRAGTVVARRSIRLPVLLGVPALSASGGALRIADQAGPCIVDRFVDGRLRTSRTQGDCADPLTTPTPSGRAVERLQVRRDPFGAASAAVFVPEPRDLESLQRLAAVVFQRQPRDVLAKACARAAAECPDGAGGYLAARASEGLFSIPLPVSGMTKAVAAVAAQRSRLRWATLLSLCLCGLSLAALVLRRGLSGGEQARAWMEATEETRALEARARLRGMLVIGACVAALLLAFVAVGLYVMARGAH